MNHFNDAGSVLVLLAVGCLMALLGLWYWREALRLRQTYRRAKRIRAWRQHMVAMGDRPFRLTLLTAGERRHLVNAAGQSSDEWMRCCIDDFKAGRRDNAPTCAEYLAAFGRRPGVREPQS